MTGADLRGAGELAARLEALPLLVERHVVDLGPVSIVGFYEGTPRPRGILTLHGAGTTGRGECVAWTPADQRAFASACGRLVPRGATTIAGIAAGVRAAHPYHRTAIEGAAIDLALRQAGTGLFALAGRPPRPVRFCWSIAASRDPRSEMEFLLAANPEARLKIDCPPAGWSDSMLAALAGSGRIVVVDFKQRGDPARVDQVHAALPDAWLEDPPDAALPAAAAWRRRLALDGPVGSAAALACPATRPAAVNVKAPRVGGWIEALRCLSVCAREGWEAYMGGMFEVGPGRRQARALAALFTAEAWNDLAPIRRRAVDPVAASPAPAPAEPFGFG